MWIPRIIVFTALAVPLVAGNALATCLPIGGDLNGTGATNVSDVQCSSLLSLWNLAGQTTPIPECLLGGDLERADLNCDANVDVQDVQIAVLYAQTGLDSALDGDGDGCPDTCGPIACTGCPAPCCAESEAPGCVDAGCEDCVCDIDPFCCNAAWDYICAVEAGVYCDDACACPGTDEGDCCSEHVAAGCALDGCTDCVCGVDPYCCEATWDEGCTAFAQGFCQGACGCGQGPPSCCDTGPVCGVGTDCCEDDSDCDDGDACTSDLCLEGGECEHLPLDCADDDLCTTETCQPLAGCVSAPVDCDDAVACTLDACQDGACVHVPVNEACTDGIADTLDVCEPSSVSADGLGCTHTGGAGASGICFGQSVVCGVVEVTDWTALSPPPGEYVVCPLRIAVAQQVFDESCAAAAMQMIVRFDPQQLALYDLFDEVCFPGAGCVQVPVTALNSPFAQPLTTGHTLTVTPNSAALWNQEGAGAFTAINLSNPATPISEATWWNGETQGDSVVFTAFFTPVGEVTAESPAIVCVDDVLLTSPSFFELPVASAPDGTLLTDCPP